MKPFKYLLVLALVLSIFTSCKKDDDSMETMLDNAALIVGTWHYTMGTTNGTLDPPEDCQEFFAVTFREDLNMTIFDREGANCETSIQIQGTYSINENTLTVNTGETLTGEILELTANILKIRFVEGSVTEVETYEK
tara:strand:- start:507 stop:917 length:411 start_codon:yes stop_codon:yes gene_type:complete